MNGKLNNIILLIIVAFFICFSVSSANAGSWVDNWTLNGVPLKNFRHSTGKQKIELVAGIGTSFAVHCASHLIYAEMIGADWHMEMHGWSPSEIVESPMTKSQCRNFARAGMVGQLIVGTALKLSTKNGNYFVTGYEVGTFLEVVTYPMIHNNDFGDLHMIGEFGGNQNVEYGIYSIWSTVLLLEHK